MIFDNDETPLYTPFYYSPEEIKYFSTNSGFSDDENLKPLKLKFRRLFLNGNQTNRNKRQTDNYPRYMKYLVANNQSTEDDDEVRRNPRSSVLLQNMLPPKENDPGSFILPCSIGSINKYVRMIKTKMNTKEDELMKINFDLFTYNTNSREIKDLLSIDPGVFSYDIDVQESYEEIIYKYSLIAQETNRELRLNLTSTKKKLHWYTPISRKKEGVQEIWASSYWESENDGKRIEVEWDNLSLNDWLRVKFGEVNPDGCGESKENEILGTVLNKLHDEWFKGTYEDDDDLEGIIDYLKPTLYEGFVDSDDEEYKERKCRLLGMTYIKPLPILIEKVSAVRRQLSRPTRAVIVW
nr:hypothetical protein [Tanacetum cinerariifolium]